MSSKKDKTKTFEPPKAVDVEGKEITMERLEDEDLEGVAGGECCSCGCCCDPPTITCAAGDGGGAELV